MGLSAISTSVYLPQVTFYYAKIDAVAKAVNGGDRITRRNLPTAVKVSQRILCRGGLSRVG
jgi:hypothetical protein